MLDVSDTQVGTTTVDLNPPNEIVDLKKELIRDEYQESRVELVAAITTTRRVTSCMHESRQETCDLLDITSVINTRMTRLCITNCVTKMKHETTMVFDLHIISVRLNISPLTSTGAPGILLAPKSQPRLLGDGP